MQELRLICDFNAEVLLRCLENSRTDLSFNCELVPFASWHQCLIEPSTEKRSHFIWIRPEAACPSFRRLMDFEELRQQDLLDDVGAFFGMLKSLCQSSASPLLLTNFSAPHSRGLGLSDASEGLSAG